VEIYPVGLHKKGLNVRIKTFLPHPGLHHTYCRNPTGRDFFVPAGTLIAVKLLSGIKKKTVLVMGAITGNGSAISSNGKLRVWVLTYVPKFPTILLKFQGIYCNAGAYIDRYVFFGGK
jgi:hypothetical protein